MKPKSRRRSAAGLEAHKERGWQYQVMSTSAVNTRSSTCDNNWARSDCVCPACFGFGGCSIFSLSRASALFLPPRSLCLDHLSTKPGLEILDWDCQRISASPFDDMGPFDTPRINVVKEPIHHPTKHSSVVANECRLTRSEACKNGSSMAKSRCSGYSMGQERCIPSPSSIW